MKLIIYVQGDAVRQFPSLGRMARQCVGLHAERIGADVVRWTLTGPADTLNEYAEIARSNGLKYGVKASKILSE